MPRRSPGPLLRAQREKHRPGLVREWDPGRDGELKTDFTQSIQHATKQYQFDRLPKDAKTGRAEPLLTFKRGALVHFAASTDEVRMTTFLDGPKTVYLPFNLGNAGAAGNPPNPDGHRTAYLWERVFQRDAWLEILEKFIHLEKSRGRSATRRSRPSASSSRVTTSGTPCAA